MATRSADFLLSALRPNNQLVRAWHNYAATSAVFLEDYASYWDYLSYIKQILIINGSYLPMN
ncbi:MAG: hypothetical protein IPL17_15200 [Anaerolineales bacterium]|nr:hypothetical protein [Anaerolineales bacterium]